MANRCSARVSIDSWRFGQCSRKAIVERDGKWYCKIHDPEYIKTKDEKYTSPCVQILCFIMILLFIGVTIYGIYLTAEDDIESDISKIVKEVSYDICPMLGNNYVSIEFFESEYQINKIDCHNFCIDNC